MHKLLGQFLLLLLVENGYTAAFYTKATLPSTSSTTAPPTISPTVYSWNKTVGQYILDASRPVDVKISSVKIKKKSKPPTVQVFTNVVKSTAVPTSKPSISPSSSTQPTYELFYYSAPSGGLNNVHRWRPTKLPSRNSSQSSRNPSNNPSSIPNPTVFITVSPIKPSRSIPQSFQPTAKLSATPSVLPFKIASGQPTLLPTINPTLGRQTTFPSSNKQPASAPAVLPTTLPSNKGTTQIPTSMMPTMIPTSTEPSQIPTLIPTSRGPTQIPSMMPTMMPTSMGPTQYSTKMTTTIPTSRGPTQNLSKMPTATPSNRGPTQIPTKMTTMIPSSRGPTQSPSKMTTATPSSRGPTPLPSKTTTMMPSTSGSPTAAPSQRPSVISPADDIQYRGGLVYTGDMKIFNIYYGDFSGNGSQSVALTNYLAANLGNSSWYNILSSYYGIVGGSRVYVHGSLTFVGSYNLFPKWRGNSTTIPAIKQDVAKYIFDKGIIKPDPYTIYAVIFRGDFTVTSGSGQKWLVDWCGVHSGVRLVDDANYYPLLFMGDISSVTPAADRFNCTISAPYPNGNQAADSIANIYAHEVAEVITDPMLNQGWTFNPDADRVPPRYPPPWENGDECAWTFPSSGYSKVGAKNFTLQQNWQPGDDI